VIGVQHDETSTWGEKVFYLLHNHGVRGTSLDEPNSRVNEIPGPLRQSNVDSHHQGIRWCPNEIQKGSEVEDRPSVVDSCLKHKAGSHPMNQFLVKLKIQGTLTNSVSQKSVLLPRGSVMVPEDVKRWNYQRGEDPAKGLEDSYDSSSHWCVPLDELKREVTEGCNFRPRSSGRVPLDGGWAPAGPIRPQASIPVCVHAIQVAESNTLQVLEKSMRAIPIQKISQQHSLENQQFPLNLFLRVVEGVNGSGGSRRQGIKA